MGLTVIKCQNGKMLFGEKCPSKQYKEAKNLYESFIETLRGVWEKEQQLRSTHRSRSESQDPATESDAEDDDDRNSEH